MSDKKNNKGLDGGKVVGDLDHDFSGSEGFFLVCSFCEKRFSFLSRFLDLQYDDRSCHLSYFSSSGRRCFLSFEFDDDRRHMVAFSLFVSFISVEINLDPRQLFLELVAPYPAVRSRRYNPFRKVYYQGFEFYDKFLDVLNRKVNRVCSSQFGWSKCSPQFVPMSPDGDQTVYDITTNGYQVGATFVRIEYNGIGMIMRRDPPDDYDAFYKLMLFRCQVRINVCKQNDEDYGLYTGYFSLVHNFDDEDATNTCVLLTGVVYGITYEHLRVQARLQAFKKLFLAPGFYLTPSIPGDTIGNMLH